MDTPFFYDVDLEQFSEPARSVVKRVLENMEPTEDDIKRVLTDDEQKELCRKIKCRVDAFRWNPVEDYNRYFKRRNRFVGKTPLEQRQLLAKAVNRYYHIKWKFDEEEIRKERRREWIIQKKNNLLSLNLWARERQEKLEEQQNQEIESLIEEVSEISNDIPPPELQPTQMPEAYSETLDDGNQRHELLEEIIEHAPVLLTQQVDEEECSSSSTDDEESASGVVHFLISQSPTNAVSEHNTEEQNYLDDESININSEELRKRGIPNKNLVQRFDVNTDSLTLASELPDSQSMTILNGIHSQDVINDYDDFDNGVPQTSTQSQGLNK
ncbi:caravaggio [Musca autumnalis]|uniref:caravaggio n=1 Tax=Musca autumnalis TaxID=221902 RepID=UPI003CF43AA6